MKKNGEEIRPNGNKIIRYTNGDYVGYRVLFLCSDKVSFNSEGTPWDYLYNARKEADNPTPGNVKAAVNYGHYEPGLKEDHE